MKKLILATLFLLVTSLANATTYYIREDGGTTTQCTGTTNAAYPGSGTGQACALSHPAWALGSIGTSGVMVAGDTLIDGGDGAGGAGSYMIGYGMPNANCSTATTNGCTLDAPPSGSSINAKTKIYGFNYASCDSTAVTDKTEFWGTERLYAILYLFDNTDVQCLNITDHSACIYAGPNDGTVGAYPVKCNSSTYSYGTWAYRGIYANASNETTLTNVDIHGLADAGIAGVNLTNFNLIDSNIVANGWRGWDSDYHTDDSYYGTVTIERSHIDWNGCGEKYPLTDTNLSSSTDKHHCWSQDQGGYGDAIGLGAGEISNWVILDSTISHNTSDGLDLLYGSGSGTTTIKRSVMEGNAGNQLKIANTSLIENSKIIGNCAFFNGQPFTSIYATQTSSSSCSAISGTWTGTKCLKPFNHCRSGGIAIEVNTKLGSTTEFFNNTIYSNGDLVLNNSNQGTIGTFDIENNIFYHGKQWNGGGQNAGYYNCCRASTGTCSCTGGPTSNYNVIYNRENTGQAPSGTGNVTGNPLLNETSNILTGFYGGLAMDVSLASTSSSAYNLADETINISSTFDFNGYPRGANWDSGALQYGSVSTALTCADDCSLCTSANCVSTGPSCYLWSNNACKSVAETCSDNYALCLTKVTCEGAGFYWYNSACSDVAPPCDTTCTGCFTLLSCEAVIDPAADCLGGWNLNENAASSTVDDTCGNSIGTLKANGTAINTSTVYTATDTINGGFTFNGSTNTRSVDFGDLFDLSADDAFSLEAWVKSTSISTEQHIVGQIDSNQGQRGYVMAIYNSKLNLFVLTQSNFWETLNGGFIATGSTTLSSNTKYHLVATYDGSRTQAGVKLYVNGVLETNSYSGGDNIIGDFDINTNNFAIGARVGSGGSRDASFIGVLDNVRIYSKALSQAEVTTQYNSGSGTETVTAQTQQCFWDSDSSTCSTSAVAPTCTEQYSLCLNQVDCENAGFYWWTDSACHDVAENDCDTTCAICTNSTDCGASAATCYWWSTNQCKSSAETAVCDSTCSACTTQVNCQNSPASCAWLQEQAFEDFTAYTEYDANNNITVGTNTITVSGMQAGTTASISSCDYNSPTTDILIDEDVTITERTDGQIVGVWGLNGGEQTIYEMANNPITGGYVLSYGTDGGSFSWYLEYFGLSWQYVSDEYADAGALPISRHITVSRVGTLVNAYIYTDSGKGTLLDTLTLDSSGGSFPCTYAFLNRGVTGTETTSLTVSNLDLNMTNACSTSGATTCASDCTACVTQQGCTSTGPSCYWWSNNTCKTSSEPLSQIQSSLQSTTQSITITGQNLTVSFP